MGGYTINTGKEEAAAPRPVVFCDFAFPDGTAWYVASVPATFNGHTYEARIDDQQVDQLQVLSQQGIDRVPSVTLKLADPDAAAFTAYERGHGFKGAALTLRFALMDLSAGTYSTDQFVPFVGVCDEPASDEQYLTVAAQSKLNLANYLLPTVPIQVTCPWVNPTTVAQRAAAAAATSYQDSPYWLCGETRDLTTAPPCNYTTQTCTQPRRRGNVTFVPKTTDTGVEYVSGNEVSWTNADTSAKYNEYWPLWLGGMAWMSVAVLNQMGDGNYTRGEAAIGFGEVAVQRVIVNGVECTQNTAGGTDYYWAYTNNGQRDGTPNPDAGYNGLGDPYGNLTVIEWRVPKSVVSPETVPTIQVLAQKSVGGTLVTPSSIAIVSANAGSSGNPGPIVIHFARALTLTTDPYDGAAVTITGAGFHYADGSWIMRFLDPPPYDHATLQGSFAPAGSGSGGTMYYNQVTQSGGGPAPGLAQELLSWCGVQPGDLNGTTFSDSDAICNALITTQDGSGNNYTQPRFSNSVALRQRRSAADIMRGLRQSVGGMLTQEQDGTIGFRIEGPLAEQQPAAVDGSNYSTAIASTLRDGTAANGYTAYRFDETNSWNLKRRPMPVAQMPNRITFGFQDPVQDYAISTFSLVDSDDVARVGRTVQGGLQVQPEGIASYNHALRCARLGLNKIHRGNPEGDTRGTDFWEWETSFRGCKLRIGQIVTVNSTKYGMTDQQIRLTEIKPAKNWQTITLAGHHHEDSWYLDSHGNAQDPQYGSAPKVGVGPTVPPTFAVEAGGDGSSAEVTGLAFSDLTNAYSITAGTWTFYYVLPNSPLTTLAAALGASDATVTLTDASHVASGDYLQIGAEIVQATGAPSSGVVPIARGQLGSTAAAAANGASCWAVEQTVQTCAFPLSFVNSAAFADWSLLQPLPGTKLVSVGGSVTNGWGDSPVHYVCLTGNSTQGLLLQAGADISYAITNGTSSPALAGAGTTGSPFVLPAEAAVYNIVATTQDVYLLLPAESGMSGKDLTFNLAAGSTHSVWLRENTGDSLNGSTADYQITPGAGGAAACVVIEGL